MKSYKHPRLRKLYTNKKSDNQIQNSIEGDVENVPVMRK